MSLPLSQLVFASDLLMQDGAFELLDPSGVSIQPNASAFQPVLNSSSLLLRPSESLLQPPTILDDWLHNAGPLTSSDAFDDHRYGPSDSDFDRLVNSNHDYYDKVPQMDFGNDLIDHSYAYFLPPSAAGLANIITPIKPVTSSSTVLPCVSDRTDEDSADPDEHGLQQMECEWWTEEEGKCTWKGARCKMEDHVSDSHIGRGIKNPVCRWNHCDKTFVRRYLMLRHVRCLHCDDRPFSCSECGQRFALKERMKLHQRVAHGLHLQLKLPNHYKNQLEQSEERAVSYPCNECGLVFLTTAHRRHHVERTHQKTRFSCEFCHTTLSDRSSLMRHKKKLHPHLMTAKGPI